MKTKRVKNGTVKIRGKRYPVPEWAAYVAVDQDGGAWCYDGRPKEGTDSWWPDGDMDNQRIGFAKRKQWSQSLRRLKR